MQTSCRLCVALSSFEYFALASTCILVWFVVQLVYHVTRHEDDLERMLRLSRRFNKKRDRKRTKSQAARMQKWRVRQQRLYARMSSQIATVPSLGLQISMFFHGTFPFKKWRSESVKLRGSFSFWWSFGNVYVNIGLEQDFTTQKMRCCRAVNVELRLAAAADDHDREIKSKAFAISMHSAQELTCTWRLIFPLSSFCDSLSFFGVWAVSERFLCCAHPTCIFAELYWKYKFQSKWYRYLNSERRILLPKWRTQLNFLAPDPITRVRTA